ncbi:MAG: alpha-amylase [Alkalibacterium sp.]|uniref:alpha-amylase n=1 Tax=Alkalibacterium TaxID=99906 RepID=UPI0026488635|nr:alpha-amylase [Alkalibacterium sp.]MDN6293176.1 alpha-amylase [Alkalibacterium sp.]MDN6294817.1 alpha-amylase [Alkalibacterium sp.]MDN6397472.1 alpha-amylase [Alkalibacterium sp.]MDN6728854.1 alpha-amylase [Alkalibacterium sp.]
MNGTMMQYFEWDLPNDGKHWQRLKEDAAHLKEIGITSVWIPPCYKGVGQADVGYGIYDLYDLGEFDQKGTIRTKYGTKKELLEAIDALHQNNIQVYADVVLNHKGGADETETFKATPVNENNRHEAIGETREISAWTQFNFPGRDGKHSDFKWHWHHFSGVSDDEQTGENGIFRIEGENKGWAPDDNVSTEFGNYDYLMFADIDYNNPEVIEETKKWIHWFIKETSIDGIRLDAVKHIDSVFMKDLIEDVRKTYGEDFFFVAEYWHQRYKLLEEYLEEHDYSISMMDVRFHYALHEASKQHSSFDLRRLLDGTLYKSNAEQAVTFVENHDSQPGQSLESYVEPWFKPLAYGFILLSSYGYPCVFYSDYYGYSGEVDYNGCQREIDKLLYVRQDYAYGKQNNYLDHSNCIGFTRMGDEKHPEGCAVIMSNGDEGSKKMYVGKLHAGEVYSDLMENREEEIMIDEEGHATFTVNAESLSVWIKK